MFLGGCPCCGKKECWKCYRKFNLPDNCNELPEKCVCGEKTYTFPDTFHGVLSYDSINYNPASSLKESEVDFSQLQTLLDSGKSGMTFKRSNLFTTFGTNPNRWVFSNTPDGSSIPERCGDFSGNISSTSTLDLNCLGPAKPFFYGAGFSVPGAGQANYYNTILPNSNGFGYCDWGVFSLTSEIGYSICDSDVLTITLEGASRAQIADCLDKFGTTASSYAVYDLVNAKFIFTIPLIIADPLGACCLPNGDCSITSHQECADECGIWTPDATCEDDPCEVVEAEESQCFDAPPEEDGWTPVGKCHADQENCDAACGWRCYGKFNLPEDCGDVPPDLLCCGDLKPSPVLILTIGEATYDESLTDDKVAVNGAVGEKNILNDFKNTLNAVCNKTFRLHWIERYQCWGTEFGDFPFDFQLPRPNINVRVNCDGVFVEFYVYTFEDPHGAFVSYPPGTPEGKTLMLTTFYNYSTVEELGLDCSLLENPSVAQVVPKIYQAAAGNGLYLPDSPLAWAHARYSFQSAPSLEQPSRAGRAEIDIVSVEFDTNTLPDSPTVGTCCLPNGDCTVKTFEECEEQCGIWTPDATCEDDPCDPVEADEYQCFGAPPEEGWLPVGGTHVDEDTCNAACPSDTTPPPGGRTMTTKTIGPGSHLKRMLAWFNIKAKEGGCSCKSLQKRMDRNGPQWCRDNLESVILPHLAKEAKKRKLPFVRLAAEKLVRIAIRKAENDSA